LNLGSEGFSTGGLQLQTGSGKTFVNLFKIPDFGGQSNSKTNNVYSLSIDKNQVCKDGEAEPSGKLILSSTSTTEKATYTISSEQGFESSSGGYGSVVGITPEKFDIKYLGCNDESDTIELSLAVDSTINLEIKFEVAGDEKPVIIADRNTYEDSESFDKLREGSCNLYLRLLPENQIASINDRNFKTFSSVGSSDDLLMDKELSAMGEMKELSFNIGRSNIAEQEYFELLSPIHDQSVCIVMDNNNNPSTDLKIKAQGIYQTSLNSKVNNDVKISYTLGNERYANNLAIRGSDIDVDTFNKGITITKDKLQSILSGGYTAEVTLTYEVKSSKINKNNPKVIGGPGDSRKIYIVLSNDCSSEKKETPTPTPTPTPPPAPVVYSLRVLNPNSISADILVDGTKVGSIVREKEKSFTLTSGGEKSVVIKGKDREEVSQSLLFTESSPTQTISYDPSAYTLIIQNPQKVSGTINLNGTDAPFSGDFFQKTYTTKENVNINITAQWYEDKEFSADFRSQVNYAFSYEPQPIKGSIAITDVPSSLKVYLDGNEMSYQRDGKNAVIPNLAMGKQYTLILESPQYESQTEVIELISDPLSVSFGAQKFMGILQVKGVSDNLAKNLKLLMNNKEYSILDEIKDLPVGTYNDVVLLFRVNHYIRRSNPRSITVKPSTQGKTILNLDQFGVKVLSIVSNRPQTKIYFASLSQFVDDAPIDIPVIDETFLTIIAKTPNEEDSRRVNLNQLTDNTVRFRFPSPQAEKLFDEASEFYDKNDFLNAERKINEVLVVDQLHEEALILRMQILFSELESALTRKQEKVFKSKLDKAEDFLTPTLHGITEDLEKLKVQKNIGKFKYEYAEVFLNNNAHKINYLENEVIELLSEALKQTSGSGLFGIDNYHFDEAECYLAKTYQRLFELSQKQEFKQHALRIWRGNHFRDYPGRTASAPVETNPFRQIKEDWLAKLK